jgi:enoyl-CoA hydratase/carnithine racemase
MACTVRVAALDAKLCMPPARLGLVYSATGLERFLRAIAPSAAQRLFLSAVVIEGAEAARIGLVDVPAPDPLAAALALADKIAQNAPLAVRGLLDAIRACAKPGGLTDDDREMIDAARELTVHSADLAEGARAFLEKRAPVFTGR